MIPPETIMRNNILDESRFRILFWFTASFARAAEPIARTLEGIGAVIVSGDDTFARIAERYMTSWSMASRRAQSRDDVLAALANDATTTWVAIIDLDS